MRQLPRGREMIKRSKAVRNQLMRATRLQILRDGNVPAGRGIEIRRNLAQEAQSGAIATMTVRVRRSI